MKSLIQFMINSTKKFVNNDNNNNSSLATQHHTPAKRSLVKSIGHLPEVDSSIFVQ